MAFKFGYRVSVVDLLVNSLILLCCLCSTKCNPLLRHGSSSCTPRDGLTGSANSVVIRVQRFADVSSNFHRDKPRLLSNVHRTISNDGKLHFFGNNLKAKFYGREVCFSAEKKTVLNEKRADEETRYSCEQVCLEVGTDGTLVTNSSSGGRLWPGKGCCVWNIKRYFQLTLMNKGPRCLQCQGRECFEKLVTTERCPPGDKCVAITLNRQHSTTGTNSSIVPIMLGCSSDKSLRGYTCNDGCQRKVKLVGSGTRNVCVRCCTGNECNKKEETKRNETETAELGDRAHDVTAPKSGSIDLKSDTKLVLIPLILTLWFFRSKVDLAS